MRKRVLFASGLIVLAILIALVIWQVSFSFGELAPSSPQQTYIFWAVSTLIILLTITLGFMLMRTAVKLYLEKFQNREGSRIKTKLVAGALGLTILPVCFLVVFSYAILNRNLEKWFTMPAENAKLNLVTAGAAIDGEIQTRVKALGGWLSVTQETLTAAQGGAIDWKKFQEFCASMAVGELVIENTEGQKTILCRSDQDTLYHYTETVRLFASGRPAGKLIVTARAPADLAAMQREIDQGVRQYDQLAANKRYFRNLYLLFLLLITLFILFVATWLALFMAKQISVPISALLEAAGEARRGNLSHRVRVGAVDELGSLVRGFNDMLEGLELSARELEKRRRFTEAILESIPTGVISLSSDGRILRVNRALAGIFPEAKLVRALQVEDLFSFEDAAEIYYLMKRARRVGIAGSQIEYRNERQVLHLSVTMAALPHATESQDRDSGFVLVLEDTSELLRAQKQAAWQEVARRIAHELKNPLTPMALCAERIQRQLDRPATPDTGRILRECAATIGREVETVKSLADEFSRFSRFPAAQPVPGDLNEIVRNAISVFDGRLENINLRLDLAPHLPPVNADPEQFKRVIVNLVDNAAEAMQDSQERRLLVATHCPAPDTVELLIADTGCGISADDKEKLFLPYFSTKDRGTGLGLAIVNHILNDHEARITVEDNQPAGARFRIEIPACVEAGVEAGA